MTAKIAFQGELGAYSHQACAENYPDLEPLACGTFEDAIAATRSGAAKLAMLPVENSTFGRVADIHHLLPGSGLHIVDEAFVRVHINLLALPGTTLDQVTSATSHSMLLGQCRAFLTEHGIERITGADTAGSAKLIAEQSDPEPDLTRRGEDVMITSFIFRVRNIPAALYKAMGGFATNGVNMTKLESYMVGGHFTATQFYADIEGHPEDPNVKLALDELSYFTSEVNILGVYPSSTDRDS